MLDVQKKSLRRILLFVVSLEGVLKKRSLETRSDSCLNAKTRVWIFMANTELVPQIIQVYCIVYTTGILFA